MAFRFLLAPLLGLGFASVAVLGAAQDLDSNSRSDPGSQQWTVSAPGGTGRGSFAIAQIVTPTPLSPGDTGNSLFDQLMLNATATVRAVEAVATPTPQVTAIPEVLNRGALPIPDDPGLPIPPEELVPADGTDVVPDPESQVAPVPDQTDATLPAVEPGAALAEPGSDTVSLGSEGTSPVGGEEALSQPGADAAPPEASATGAGDGEVAVGSPPQLDVPPSVPATPPPPVLAPVVLSPIPTPTPTPPAPAQTPPSLETPTPAETATPAPTPTHAFPTLVPGSSFNAPRDTINSAGPAPTMRPMPTAVGSSYMPSYTGYPLGSGTPVTSPGASGTSVPSSSAPGGLYPPPSGGSSSTTPPPAGGSGSTAGLWSGTTSQGRPITFTVAGDAITSITVGYSLTGCLSQDGTVSQNFNGPNAAPPTITDNSFYIVTPPSTGMGIGFVQGSFSSATSASGTLKMSLISFGTTGADGAPCSPSAEATWTASHN